MNNELVGYSRGEVIAPRVDRAVARQAKQVYDKARLAAMEADAVIAVAGHVMEGVADLDAKRKDLAQEDVTLHMALADIEMMAIRQIKSSIQRDFGSFGF